MPVYNMSTNKWVLSKHHPYKQTPSYWESDSDDDESIDYTSSDEDCEEVQKMTTEELLAQMLRDINEDKESDDKETSKNLASAEHEIQVIIEEIINIIEHQ